MKKLVTRIGTGLLALSVLGAALVMPQAANAKVKAAPKLGMSKTVKETQVTGTVTAASAHRLTIAPTQKQNGASQTFMVPASAKIMWGKRIISMATVKPGAKVTVINHGGVATRVTVYTQAMKAGAHPATKGKMSGSKMSGSKMSGKK